MAPRPLKVVTYNIHRCYGADGAYDPGRVARVLREIDADVVGLQEVDSTLAVPEVEARGAQRGQPLEALVAGHDPKSFATRPRHHQLDYLAEATGLHAVEGLLEHDRWGRYGNGLLTRFPVIAERRVDLTVRGASERRGALDVDLTTLEGRTLRVFVAHLGLQVWERHFQMRRLVKALGEDRDSPVVMMGDFNLWVSVLPRLRCFYARLGHAPLARTYPSRWPCLSLDRIWTQPFLALKQVEAHRTALSAVASDHLPLVATVDFV
jgi:endonuclease/exonuclease/phosphatase family metal-dependent hydrolase